MVHFESTLFLIDFIRVHQHPNKIFWTSVVLIHLKCKSFDTLNFQTLDVDNSTTDVAAVVCGSCYGAETEDKKCCSTCAEVHELYRLGRQFRYRQV